MNLLREGFTTGTCAAAAAKAAAALLTGRSLPDEVDISLPGGKRISMPVEDCSLDGNVATAVVKKRSEERRVGKECRSRGSPDH